MPLWYSSFEDEWIDLVFYGMTFMWAVGINQTLVLFLYPPPAAGGYGFSNLAAGLFYYLYRSHDGSYLRGIFWSFLQ